MTIGLPQEQPLEMHTIGMPPFTKEALTRRFGQGLTNDHEWCRMKPWRASSVSLDRPFGPSSPTGIGPKGDTFGRQP